ncbi:hypothetical protein [Thomasclavelia spiroformis]|uniref:hypothetical protein n=1 Tax=Thomasclavelia spiroformis TaxID=29348 RepID=UPI00242DAB30|nr:hypothetical protein [Thomasclavelia spiroformis]
MEMSNVDYKGSVTLISGLTQANNGSFPLVDGDAVQYKQEINEDGTFKSVSQKLSEFNRSYEYATSDDIDGILNGLFGQWKRLSLTEDTMLENTLEDQLKILSVNGNSYQPTSNNIVPTPAKPIPIISKKTNIKRISPNVFDFEKENDTSNIPDSGTYRSIRSYQLKPDTQYIFSWSSATVPAKGTLSFQIQNNTGTVLVSPFTYFNISSDEKEETGKDVEFTTDSSGIIKFAYNCIVGTSSSLETYQQYWYTKILRDIALKESVLESEQIELRSLKETINKFDLGLLSRTELIETSGPYRKINIPITLKPNTRYKIYYENSMIPALTWAVLNIVDNTKKRLIAILNVKNTENNEVEKQAINSAFISPIDGEIYFSYFVQSFNAEGVKVPQNTEVFKEKWFTKILKNIMITEESLNQTTYVAPTVRDYKIVDHTNKTSKIVRNINQFELPTDFSWNDTDYYPNITGNVIPEDKKGVYDTGDYNLINYTIKQYLNYSNVTGTYLGFSECDTYWGLNNSDEVNAFLTRVKEDGKPFIFQYQLATPVEEPITYVETDVSEVGYSWQDTTSPSPTTPSQIEGVNEIDITITGKNLFDIEYVSNSENWTNSNTDGYYYIPIKVPKEKQLYLSNDKTIAGGRGYYANFSPYKDKNAENYYFFYHNTSGSAYGKFDRLTKDEVIYLRINSIANNLSLFIEDFKHLQLEVGDVATAYEPYKPLQSLSYQLDTPLKGINNTKDIIDIESNQRTDNLTIFVLDDKTTKSIIVGTTKEKTQVFQLDISDIFNDNDIWCDKLKNDRNKDEELFTYQSGNIYISIDKNRLETIDVAGFKKWLKDNPLTFTGSATTPTQEILPEDLPAELNKLKTNDGSTVIYINGEVKPSLNIEYKGT